MIKRPMCLAAVILLCIQMILTGGFQIAKDLKSSDIEKNIKEGAYVELLGTIFRRNEKSEYQIIYLTDVQVCYNKQILNESKILVYINFKNSETQQNKETFSVGNQIRVSGEVSFFESATNPGNFDQKEYYQKQSIHACVWADEAEVLNREYSYVKEKLTQLRISWKELLIREMGEVNGNSMSAILLGDKSELDVEMKDLYQKSGIGHILAISGLHMSFIGIGFYNLLRKAGIGFVPAGITGIIFLTLYTTMIGAGVSSIRALIMFFIRIGADMTGRVYDLPTSLAMAAVGIILWQPLYLFDAGFLLSFGAVIGIAAIEPIINTFHIFPKILSGGMAIQLVSFPLVLYFYFETPSYSQILNLLIIPLTSVLLGAGILGSVLYMIYTPLGSLLLKICSIILWIYEKSCELSMELPFARLTTGQPPICLITIYYFVLFIIICRLWVIKNKMERTQKAEKTEAGVRTILKRIVYGGGMLLLITAFCFSTAISHGKKGELKVIMLDVGQGDGIYIRTPSGMHILIDGGSSDVSEVGKYRLEPFLESQGVKELDYVFITHGDGDHTSGIVEMLNNQTLGIKIHTIVLTTEKTIDESLLKIVKLAFQNDTKVVVMEKGEYIQDEEMTLTCLSPAKDYDGEVGNASSMVLDLQYREFDMLFTGDLEQEGEKELAESWILRDYDILKVGHHGSKNSTSEDLLEAVRPEIAFISAGKENQYGHPHQETLERLSEAGCKIFSTQECGAISIVTDGEYVSMEKSIDTD